MTAAALEATPLLNHPDGNLGKVAKPAATGRHGEGLDRILAGASAYNREPPADNRCAGLNSQPGAAPTPEARGVGPLPVGK
jgi:hypothetical protein